MIKNISLLLILFLTFISQSQNITLVKNTNPKAKELIHNLNPTNDSLVLSCENKIIKVDIFNEDYDNIIEVEDFSTKISLREMPVGKFVIQTKLNDKIIVIDLIVYNKFEDTSNSESAEIAEGNGIMLDEGLNIIESNPKNSVAFMLTREKPKKQNCKSQKFFWTETQIKNMSGSNTTRKLVDLESAERMIRKNKQELNSDTGNLNELTVWEVYNTSKFMKNQVSNPDFVYSSTTDLFNTTPYYTSSKTNQNQ